MQTRLSGLCLLLAVACGGNPPVDLGGNSPGSGWADTKGDLSATAPAGTAATPTTSKPAVTPQTLYGGVDYPRTIAVDETTIAAVMVDSAAFDTRLELCQLADCRGTRQILHDVAETATTFTGNDYPGPIQQLIIANGDVIWSARSARNSRRMVCTTGCTNVDGYRILSCPTTGCPDGARQIAVAQPYALVAGHDYLYWIEIRDLGLGVARCPIAGCDTAEFQLWPTPSADQSLSPGAIVPSQYQLALDELGKTLYASDNTEVLRIPTDFSTGFAVFHSEQQKIEGLAVAGDSVYFAISTLTGQIRRCPTTDCQQGSVLVTSAPNWPFDLLADEKSVLWRNSVVTSTIYNVPGNGLAISTVMLDGSAASRVVVERPLGSDPPYGPAMNSHHLYWCETLVPPGRTEIRMFQR